MVVKVDTEKVGALLTSIAEELLVEGKKLVVHA
jgi:hypothetical protein